MKRKSFRRNVLLSIVTLPLLFSCSLNETDSYSSSNEMDYSFYYSCKDSMKGIDIFCWKNGEWYSGILPGTNRLKTVEEVELLQENLPCPLKEMAKILSSYSEETRECAFVRIVSIPPTTGEVIGLPDIDGNEEYVYVYSQLGLPMPN